MRKLIAIAVIGSVVASVSVVTSHAATLPVDQQLVIGHNMIMPAMPAQFIELPAPIEPVQVIANEVKLIIGVKPDIEPHCNSPSGIRYNKT